MPATDFSLRMVSLKAKSKCCVEQDARRWGMGAKCVNDQESELPGRQLRADMALDVCVRLCAAVITARQDCGAGPKWLQGQAGSETFIESSGRSRVPSPWVRGLEGDSAGLVFLTASDSGGAAVRSKRGLRQRACFPVAQPHPARSHQGEGGRTGAAQLLCWSGGGGGGGGGGIARNRAARNYLHCAHTA